ncbi:ribonuclease H-like protein [Mycena crocata]|nr:ribonuclease H-like protein [Mycena crocata]
MRLDQILPVWDPREEEYPAAEEYPEDSETVVTFKQAVQIESLTDGFRVFTKPQKLADPIIPAPEIVAEGENEAIIRYAGSTIASGTAEAKAGAVIWYSNSDPRNIEGRIPEIFEQTKSSAELAAALIAVQRTSTETPLKLIGNRKTVLKAITNLDHDENLGWIGVRDKKLKRALGSALRARSLTKTLLVLDDGPESATPAEGAQRAARNQATPVLEVRTADAFDLTLSGASLSKLTQARAYRGIKELRKTARRKTTDANIKLVQDAIKNQYKRVPTAATIWKSLRHKDVTRQIRTFLWKSVHGAHRIGKFWENIPECEERAVCTHCETTESLEHILLECPSPGQTQIWALAKEFWAKKHEYWPDLSMGSLLGSGLAIFVDEKRRPMIPTARLYHIVITESLYLIWKLRCECVIEHDGKPPTESEVHNRWVHTMNERLAFDQSLTDKLRFRRQYQVPPDLVLETWRGTLKDEKDLPENWLTEAEVLVGMAPRGSTRPPAPTRGIG